MDYNSLARSYRKLHGEEQLRKLFIVRSWLESQSLLKKGTLLLDVGCGTGISKEVFPEAKITGLEPELELLRQASFDKVIGKAEHLPFKSGAFDVAICITVLHHSENPVLALKELERVCKKAIAVSVFKRSASFKRLDFLIEKVLPIACVVDERIDRIYLCKKV